MRITGVTFASADCHPERMASRSVTDGAGGHTYLCRECVRDRTDTERVAGLRGNPVAAGIISDLDAALRAGHARKAGSARRALRDWTDPNGVRAVMRHLQLAIAAAARPGNTPNPMRSAST